MGQQDWIWWLSTLKHQNYQVDLSSSASFLSYEKLHAFDILHVSPTNQAHYTMSLAAVFLAVFLLWLPSAERFVSLTRLVGTIASIVAVPDPSGRALPAYDSMTRLGQVVVSRSHMFVSTDHFYDVSPFLIREARVGPFTRAIATPASLNSGVAAGLVGFRRYVRICSAQALPMSRRHNGQFAHPLPPSTPSSVYK